MQCRSELAKFPSELTAFLSGSDSGHKLGNGINEGPEGWDDQEDDGDRAS